MTKKTRILFVLAEELGWRTYAHQVRKVLSGREDFEWEIVSPKLPRWMKAPLKRHNMSRMDRLLRHVDPISAYRGLLGQHLRETIRRHSPDLIHFAGHLPAASLAPDDRVSIPYTVAFDATRVNMNGLRDTRIWNEADLGRERALLTGAAHLFPWSSWAGDTATSDYGIPAERVSVIPPSIDPYMIGEPQKKEPGRLPRILFIGNHFLRKGGDKLYRWATGPLAGKCELHIVSGDAMVNDLQGPGVVVHGGLPHDELLRSLLPSMDLLCHPTQSDMSAYVVIEAAFAGLPSVASIMGGIPELIIYGETGWTLDRADEDGFVRTLDGLLAAPDRIAEAGRRAKAHANANFDARRNYNRMLDKILEQVRQKA